MLSKIKKQITRTIVLLFVIYLSLFSAIIPTSSRAAPSSHNNGTGEPIMLRFKVFINGVPAFCMPVFAKYTPEDGKNNPSFQHLQLMTDWNDQSYSNEHWETTKEAFDQICGSDWVKVKDHVEPLNAGDHLETFTSQDGRFRTSPAYNGTEMPFFGYRFPKIKNGNVNAYSKFKIIVQDSWVKTLASTTIPAFYFYNKIKDALEGETYFEGSVNVKISNYVDNISYPPGETGLKITADGIDYAVQTSVVTPNNGAIYFIANEEPIPINVVQKETESAVSCVLKDPIKCAINYALGIVLDAIKTMLDWFIDGINWMLNMQRDQVFSQGIAGAWSKIRDLSISLLVLVLIIIAFANALQFDIEKYGLNRMIPKIIIAIILSYLSWAIADLLFQFTFVLQNTASDISSSVSGYNVLKNGMSLGDFVTISAAGGALGPFIVIIVVAVALLIAFVILAFLLMVRLFMLSFLLAVAPLAFILMILPWTEQYYKMWWSNFLKWLFMGPLIVIIMAIGMLIFYSGSTGPVDLQGSTIGSGGGSLITKLLILIGTIVFAAYLPLKMGGKIMQGWSKAGKGVSKFAANRGLDTLGRYGAARGGKLGKALSKSRFLTPDSQKAFWSGRQSPGRARRAGYGRELQAGLSDMGAGGRFLAGVTPEEQPGLRVASLRQRQKDAQMEDWAEDRLHDVALDTNQNNWTREAAFMELTERGHVGAGRSDAKKELQRLFDSYAPNNGVIRKSAAKEQLSLLMRSSNPDYQITGVALSAKKEAKERGTGEVAALTEIAIGKNVTDEKVRGQAFRALHEIDPVGMQRVASQKGDLFESYTQTDTAKCFNDSTLAAMRTLAQAKGMTDAVANIDVIIKDRPSSPEAPPTFSSGAGI